MAKPRMTILIPIDADSVIIGARRIKSAFSAEIGKRGLSDEVQVLETGSFGPTNAGVVAAVQPDGTVYGNLTDEKVTEIVEEHVVKGRICGRHIIPREQPPSLNALLADQVTHQPGAWFSTTAGESIPRASRSTLPTTGTLPSAKRSPR